MVYAYHLIMPCYGFWLPNDPRGSWSETVRRWELLRNGQTTKSNVRRPVCEISIDEWRSLENARLSMKYPPVSLDRNQIMAVAEGFALKSRLSRYTIWACAILPDHTHMVIARHSYESEKIAIQLKGAATRKLVESKCHPLAEFATESNKKPPRMWAEHEWIVYLDAESAINDAIH